VLLAALRKAGVPISLYCSVPEPTIVLFGGRRRKIEGRKGRIIQGTQKRRKEMGSM
jgi:hypothetical protein